MRCMSVCGGGGGLALQRLHQSCNVRRAVIPAVFIDDLKASRRIMSVAKSVTVLFVEVKVPDGAAWRKLSEKATPASLVVLAHVVDILETCTAHAGAYKVTAHGSGASLRSSIDLCGSCGTLMLVLCPSRCRWRR